MQQPDFRQLAAVLEGKAPERPVLFEFFLNARLYARLAGMERSEFDRLVGAELEIAKARAYETAGYDFATVRPCDYAFHSGEKHHEKSISLNEGFVITDRAAFNAYPWEDPAETDFSRLDRIAAAMPAGMKMIPYGPGGVLENVIALTGFDNLCFMLVDDRRLAGDIFDAVGSRLVEFYRYCSPHSGVGAVISNDDWGFNTQTMLSPPDMREFVFPWHRRIAKTIHEAGKPAILHSCGQLKEVMDDVIDDMRYDAKHSFEDVFGPIERMYDEWGSRIALLGGIDVDFLIRSESLRIQDRCRAMVEKTAQKGGWALGSGNSIPDYIPDEKYFAMIESVNQD